MFRFWHKPLGIPVAIGSGLALFIGYASVQADGKPQLKSPTEIDQMLMAEIKDRAEVEPNLTHLSDVIGARMTGSENLKKANQWASEKFKAYGLENVKLEPWEIPAAWERGLCKMKLVSPDNGRDIHAAARAWTPGTKGKITGPVMLVQATKAEELKAFEGKLKNAIIMLSKPTEITPITEIGKPKAPKGPAASGGGASKAAQLPNGKEANPPVTDTPKAPTPAPSAATPAKPPETATPPAAGGPGRRGPFQGGGMGLRQQITECRCCRHQRTGRDFRPRSTAVHILVSTRRVR